MNPTNQRILKGMLSGYASGRSLQSLISDPNFSSLPFQDRTEIVRGLADVLGDKVKVQLSALGFAKEMAAGALKGAMAALPVGAIVHNAINIGMRAPESTTLLQHAKNIGNSVTDLVRDKNIQKVFGTVALIGAGAGAFVSAKNLVDRVKHNQKMVASLSEIQNAATDEQAEQAAANILFSKVMNSSPLQGNVKGVATSTGSFATKSFGAMIPATSNMWAASRAADSLPNLDAFDKSVRSVVENQDLSGTDKLKAVANLLDQLHSHKDKLDVINKGVRTIGVLKEIGFEDPETIDNISNELQQSAEAVKMRDRGVTNLINALKANLEKNEE